jgi:hypothetical protein
MAKRRKRKPQKKPRNHTVTFDMGKPVSVNGFYFDQKSGLVTLLNDGNQLLPESVIVEKSYARQNKANKILNAAPANPLQVFANPNRILEQFDELFAVDTNTRLIKSRRVSVTGIVAGTNEFLPEHTAIRFRPIKCFEFHNVEGKPENLAWKEVIEAIRQAPNYKEQRKRALIVDSDLGAIPAYNNRELPIYQDFLLPAEFTLIYASSDVGSENIANRMLSMADKVSSVILNGLEKDWKDDSLFASSSPFYSHRRTWDPPE